MSLMWGVVTLPVHGKVGHGEKRVETQLRLTDRRVCHLGLPDPKPNQLFDGLTEEMGFYTSKSFLPRVSEASKAGE